MIDMQELSAAFRKAKMVRLALICVGIAALVLTVFSATRLPGFALCAVSVCAHLFYGRKLTREYCSRVQELNLRHGLSAGMENPRITGSDTLTEEIFDTWQLLPRRHGKGKIILSRNGFVFSCRGREVHSSEITLHYGVGENKKTFHFVSGTMLWCDAGEGDWLLLHKDWIHPDALAEFTREHGYHAAQLGESLAKDFLLFSHSADAALPEELEKKITALAAQASALAAVRLCREHSVLLLVNRFCFPKVDVNALPTQRELTQNTLPERDAALKLLCP